MKLGLRAVATATAASANTPTAGSRADTQSDEAATPPLPVAYPPIPFTQGSDRFVTTFAGNLRAFGIVSTENIRQAPTRLANAMGRIMSATRLVAVDSAFAADIANALSYAMYGEPAHLSRRHPTGTMPTNWNRCRTPQATASSYWTMSSTR